MTCLAESREFKFSRAQTVWTLKQCPIVCGPRSAAVLQLPSKRNVGKCCFIWVQIFWSAFFKYWPPLASFCLFLSFSHYIDNNWLYISVVGVLGILTQDRKMVGAEDSTELWRPPPLYPRFLYFCVNFSDMNRLLSSVIIFEGKIYFYLSGLGSK